MSERIGFYICHCGINIASRVRVKEIAEYASTFPEVVVARDYLFMCSDPGQELIQKDIKDGKINRVVVASCAPSLHELTFRGAIKRAGMNPYLYEHANIREQVSWVHDGEKATAKATSLVAAAIAKTRNQEPLDPIRVEARNHTIVIGGGIAGLRAAHDLSARGIQVALVEKSPFLGGQTAMLNELVPTGEKAGDLIQALSRQVLDDENITVYTCTEVIRYEGYVGNFKLTLKSSPPESKKDLEKMALLADKNNPSREFVPFAGIYPARVPDNSEEMVLDTGAIVFATGFQLYTPRDGEYGFNENPEVITLPDLIRHLAEHPSSGRALEIGGRKIERVALIHCVGSRMIPGIHEPDADGNLNEYCVLPHGLDNVLSPYPSSSNVAWKLATR